MEQTKQQRKNIITNDYHNSKRKKLLNNSSSTNLEGLSNEIFYDIFDYLNFHHVYKAFFNLNIRFQDLVNHSIHSIKLNISSMSKSTFEDYYIHYIIPNKHRIKSLHVSNPFMIDLVFKPYSFAIIPNLIQLEILVINNIEKRYLTNLLKQLISLPKLYSLVIISADTIRCNNNLYHQLFRLPTLKYCKVDISEDNYDEILPFATNEYSSIEHLVIKNSLCLKKLDRLLSYVPQLHRLSIQELNEPFDNQINTFSTVLNHLTHLSIYKLMINFDKFELLIKNCFHQLQVLHISTNNEGKYVDANRWERLILSHIPYLKIFDIQFKFKQTNQSTFENMINQFNSSFWFERQWFFEYCFEQNIFGFIVNLYSSHPYRRKHYKLYGDRDKNNSLHDEKTNIHSVKHIEILYEKAMINCINYFPNTTKLTLWHYILNKDHYSLSTILNRILPLQQLTTLVIVDCFNQFSNVIELLNFTPYIHTLILKFSFLNENNLILYQQCQHFQIVSNKNNIKYLTINSECTFEQLKFFINLCPRLQYLTLKTLGRDFRSILLWLLSRNNNQTCHLYSLCIKHISKTEFNRMKTLIKSNRLINNYLTKFSKVNHNIVYL